MAAQFGRTALSLSFDFSTPPSVSLPQWPSGTTSGPAEEARTCVSLPSAEKFLARLASRE